MNIYLQYLSVALLLLILVEVAWFARPKKRRQVGQISMLVDTSVLMDGRVVELARTGFFARPSHCAKERPVGAAATGRRR